MTAVAQEIAQYAHNPIIHSFLHRRGLSACDIHYLLHPNAAHQHDPFLLKGVGRWIDVLHSLKGQTFAIIPDYDADGVLSGTVCRTGLYLFGFGDVYLYPPKTCDGYGLTRTSIDNVLKARPDTTVIITTDNGSNAHDGIAYAKSKGLVVLVTDHHVAHEAPPADAVVNPNGHGDNTYPFTHISGTTVIYKVLMAYARKYVTDMQAIRDYQSLVLLVGISAISDVMPMVNENRYYVTQAVAMFDYFVKGHSMERIVSYDDTPLSQYYRGVDLLVMTLNRHNKLNYGIDADTFGFIIGPILNSPRRMVGESALSFSLFQTEREPLLNGHVVPPSDLLYEMNEQRKEHVRALTSALFAHIKASGEAPIDSVVFNARMGGGIAGLLAGNFTGKFGLPSVSFSVSTPSQGHTLVHDPSGSGELVPDDIINVDPSGSGVVVGSARSPESFNLYAFLATIDAEHPGLIEKWGGHPQAAGITLKAENYEAFRSIFISRLKQHLVETDAVQPSDGELAELPIGGEYVLTNDVYDYLAGLYGAPTSCDVIRTDMYMPIMSDSRILDAVQFFEQIAPFGQGFPEPTFSMAFSVRDVRVFFMGKEKQHVKFILPNGLSIINWNGAAQFDGVDTATDARLFIATGTIGLNEFRGEQSLQLTSQELCAVTL